MSIQSIHPFPTRATHLSPRNFLFISPSPCNASCGFQCVHRKLLAAAQATAEDGYVYLAEMGRKEMEDDLFGVRHLPLQRDNLPSFGNLPVVVVQGDRELMILAHRTYPEAHVYLFEASPQFDTFTDLIAFSARLRAAA